MNSFFFEDKDPKFTKLKPGLALRLVNKGLFYIRAMPSEKIFLDNCSHFQTIPYKEQVQKHSPFVKTKLKIQRLKFQ